MQKILSVLVFMFDGWEEKHTAELIKKWEKQQEASLLAAAWAQSLQLRGQGRGFPPLKRTKQEQAGWIGYLKDE